MVAVMTISSQAATIEELRTPDTTGLHVNEQEWEALSFLYRYMFLADITDYTTQFHLENVRTTLIAREQMPWGKNVPELLFRHFVLPLRVNNEALDMFRPTYYNELKERVKGIEGCFVDETREPEALSGLLKEALAFEGKTLGRERVISDGLDNRKVAEELIGLYKRVVKK